MLHFFRKHQKVIFLGTTIVVVSSFVFFGTYNTLGQTRPTIQDKELLRLIDGSPLMRSKALLMSRFLSYGPEDKKGSDGVVNMLNDGVLEKDILSAPFARMICREFGSSFDGEIQKRIRAISHYTPYVHPSQADISEEKILLTFEPSLVELTARAKKNAPVNAIEAFSLLAEGYVKSRKLPYDMIKRVLLYQQQISGAQVDPNLDTRQDGFLGLTSAATWLGKEFIDISAELICNGAALAKSRGLSVSKASARASLLHNLKTSIEKGSKHKLQDSELVDAFYQQLAALGIEEGRCIELWQDVLLFRKLMTPKSCSAKELPDSFKQKMDLAKEVRVLDLYELPSVLRGADFNSMLKLQLYIDSISTPRQRGDILSFPKEILAASEIEKRAPELVQKRFSLEYAEVKKTDILSSIPLKEIWLWQVEDSNWPSVVQAAASLAKHIRADRDSRFSLLEALSSKERQAVDLLACNAIFENRPQLLKNALQNAEKKSRDISLSGHEDATIFSVKSLPALMLFLEKAALQGDRSPSAQAIAAQQKLLSYCDDGQHYYSISVKSRDDQRRILTFHEAKTAGLLDKMLLKKLETAYPEARRKEPALFQRANGSYKSLAEVQDIVAKFAFADLLRAIENEYTKHFGMQPLPQQTDSSSFYVTYRPLSFLHEAKEHLEIDAENTRYVYSPSTSYQKDLDKQWLMRRSRREIALSDTSLFLSSKALDTDVGNISSIVTLKTGALSIFKMVAKEHRENPSDDEMKKIEDMAASEVICDMAKDLMEKVSAKQAIKPISFDEDML